MVWIFVLMAIVGCVASVVIAFVVAQLLRHLPFTGWKANAVYHVSLWGFPLLFVFLFFTLSMRNIELLEGDWWIGWGVTLAVFFLTYTFVLGNWRREILHLKEREVEPEEEMSGRLC